MPWLDAAGDAQLHRDAYIAVLNGALNEPARKREFATRLDITPQYLSYLLNPYDHRTPSPALVERIATALPLDSAAQAGLVEHMVSARVSRQKVVEVLSEACNPADVEPILAFVQQAQAVVNFASDPQQAKAQQNVLRDMSRSLLVRINAMHSPHAFAQLCIWVSNVETALNNHADAVYYAKQAGSLLGRFAREDLGVAERVRFDDLEFNALRAESVAYHNLHLERRAIELCDAAAQTHAVRQQPAEWLPHLYRDQLNALSGLPRFSLRSAEHLAAAGKDWCERSDHPHAGLWAFMLDRSLAQAYLRYGNLKKARRLLEQLQAGVDHLPVAGPLHRVIFLKSYAEACWREGDRITWTDVITSTIQLARAAGLRHQLEGIRAQYGLPGQALLDEDVEMKASAR